MEAACDCGGKHPDGAVYFVTCMDADRVGYLVGPLPDHPAALALVDAARREAERVNPWAAFYWFGTAALPGDTAKTGVLNAAVLVARQEPPQEEQGSLFDALAA